MDHLQSNLPGGMIMQNNVTRFLDSKKIIYFTYTLPNEKHSGIETAEILGVSADIVFKSIVVHKDSPGKYILAVIPSNLEVDIKKLAHFSGKKKVKISSQNEAEKITGLLTGCISPLALINRNFEIIIDELILLHEWVHISGGQRDLNIRIKPSDLIALVNANTGDITSA